jgi:type IV pilus assembly protein PilF
LGIQLAAQYNDRNALASYGLALKNLYPKSNEYLQYKSQYQND